MRQTQKSQLGGWLIRIAFIAKNYAAILQQNPEYLNWFCLPVVVVVLWLMGVIQ